MPRPRYCSNLSCPFVSDPPPKWCVRDGLYHTAAHGTVQRYLCKSCGRRLSSQTESVYLYSKRRVDLHQLFSRLRGGSSMRDIARELGYSRTAIATAVMRIARQAIGAHLLLLCGLQHSGKLCFDGLVTAVGSRDYPAQITTLADSQQELLLAMTHCVTERGGSRTEQQKRRITKRRTHWQPEAGGLKESISLLVHELSQFGTHTALLINTDEHPIYRKAITTDLALRWYREAGLLSVCRTPGSAPRTAENPLFLVNYLDRMIRHRMAEHTRESIAVARNATMQMHRMWIFAWDHNARQPIRVAPRSAPTRAHLAGVSPRLLHRLNREFFTRRFDLRGLIVPRSISNVWSARLATPPLRWQNRTERTGPTIPAFALRDLARSCLHAQ